MPAPSENGSRAEQLIEDHRPPDGAVQRMLGREPDAGQHLLAMTGRLRAERPANAFAMAAETGEGVFPGGIEEGVGCLQGNEAFRQPVPDGLEAPDRTAELHPFQGVGASQLEHGATGTDELVAECELSQRQRGRPVGRLRMGRRRRLEFAHDLEQAEPAGEALRRPARQQAKVDGNGVANTAGRLGDDDGRVGAVESCGPEPFDDAPVPVQTSWGVGSSE